MENSSFLAEKNVALIRHAEIVAFVGLMALILLVALFGFSERALLGGAALGVLLAFVWPYLWKKDWSLLNGLLVIPIIIVMQRIDSEGNGMFQMFGALLTGVGVLWFANKQRLIGWLEEAFTATDE